MLIQLMKPLVRLVVNFLPDRNIRSKSGFPAALLWMPFIVLLGGCAQLPGAIDASSTATTSTSTPFGANEQPNVDYSILPAMGGGVTQNGHPAAWANDGNLWHYIATQFTLPVPDNARVQAQLNFYASHIEYLQPGMTVGVTSRHPLMRP
jgi:hypothetical protein